MKILVVSYMYLYGVGGGVFAARAYINALSKISDKVTLLYPEKNGKKAEGIDVGVTHVSVNYDSNLDKILARLMGRLHQLTNKARKCLEEEKYDFVVFNSSLACPGILEFAHKKGAKIITLHHNFEQEYFRDNFVGLKFFRWLLMKAVTRAESLAVCKSDLNLTITDADKYLLHDHYSKDAKIETIGCFEPCSRVPLDLSKRSAGQKRFVITGSLSDVQTYLSLKEWLDSYYDILKEVCPNFKLTIAGRNPTKLIEQMCQERDIKLIPNPQTMDEVLLSADYFICPVNRGGGLKLRIMDGLRAGLPVLTHSISARGYESFNDICLYRYCDTNTFRDSLKLMLNNSYSADNIQKLYLSIFSFDAGIKRMRQYIEKM